MSTVYERSTDFELRVFCFNRRLHRSSIDHRNALITRLEHADANPFFTCLFDLILELRLIIYEWYFAENTGNICALISAHETPPLLGANRAIYAEARTAWCNSLLFAMIVTRNDDKKNHQRPWTLGRNSGRFFAFASAEAIQRVRRLRVCGSSALASVSWIVDLRGRGRRRGDVIPELSGHWGSSAALEKLRAGKAEEALRALVKTIVARGTGMERQDGRTFEDIFRVAEQEIDVWDVSGS